MSTAEGETQSECILRQHAIEHIMERLRTECLRDGRAIPPESELRTRAEEHYTNHFGSD
jgi:hypothetical protein